MKSQFVDGLVSTIIPVFNRPEMLRLAVSSVLAQTYRPIEIIIVDDGSTDTTPRVGRELERTYQPEVLFLRQKNSGPGPARELGRCSAKGEFLQYLDSDDRLLPNKFADQVSALRRHPECDIAYGVTRLVDAAGNVLADPFKWTGKKIPHLFPGLLVDRWWCTHTPLYRRSLTDRLGPWCEMRWSQDWEYDSRIGAFGTHLVHCESTVSEHVHHDGVRQTSVASWSSDPTRLRNRLELLNVLWKGASSAGVSESSDERQHFARWCFSIARNCTSAGMPEEADECLRLALEAAGPTGAGRRGVNAYRWMLRTFGPRLTSGLSRVMSCMRRRSGQLTMEQSFAAHR